MPQILVVDDEESMRKLLSIMLERDGYRPVTAGTLESAKKLLKEHSFDVVITDLQLGNDKNGGLKILEQVRDTHPEVPTILITAYGSTDMAIEATRRGAFYYIEKPFQNDKIRLTVERAAENKRLHDENRRLREERGKLGHIEDIIGSSGPIREVKTRIRKVADLSSTVLILGESGTGKELVARAIHQMSPRADKPFVAINCGAIPANLLETELFGHKKGAFTGAVTDKKGLFEEAQGGTLMLDEVGDMELSTQVKLLRVIEERVMKPLGSTEQVPVDVRIISATNRDLETLIEEGAFREDLYYRLNVIPVRLPPLRERRDDIPALAYRFLERCTERLGKTVSTISPEAMELLEKYRWPGNVRELQNIIERAVALCSGTVIEPNDIAEKVRNYIDVPTKGLMALPADGVNLEEQTEQIERTLIEQAMQRANYSQKRAAQLLGLTPRSLRYRLTKYNMQY
ncbi:MAG: sigma-54-dependent Fis family transcriptional regulator [Candidatus Hydrogenedentes bacterium]|nr:sigma-54-dependent Fis family transcriptional regulator [Candidatus Hydrogenedentota bacterium]